MSEAYIVRRGGGGGVKMVKLWENASVTSSFAPQTLQVDLSGFDMVAIAVTYNTNNARAGSNLNISKLISNDRTLMCCICPYMTTTKEKVEPFREVAIPVEKTSITFEDGYMNTERIDNDKAIPLAIYGIKGVS